jgi:hypothetical protein
MLRGLVARARSLDANFDELCRTLAILNPLERELLHELVNGIA